MVATVSSSWNWSTVDARFDAASARCHIVAECEFTAIAINMVAAGMGVCIADPLTPPGTWAGCHRGRSAPPCRTMSACSAQCTAG